MSQKSFFDPAEFGLEDGDLIRESVAVSVISAAGGTVTGRVRLQKLVFLLDKLGLESGFSYTYHHYGPYSAELADAVDFATAFGLMSEIKEHRTSDGARYSIFSIQNNLESDPKSAFFADKKVAAAISVMNGATATVLELAATAYWLKHDEKLDSWETEIKRRKGQKTERGQLELALKLLEKIGLDLRQSAYS